MRRLSIVTAMFVLAGLFAPVSSFAQQSVNVYVGGFVPRAEDARDKQDVLWNNQDFLAFRIRDFSSGTVGAEYLVGLSDHLEAGLGVGVSSRSVPSVYANYVNSNGSEIEQTLKLRMVPFTATVRFLPLGQNSGFEPYIGAGVAVINWRYTESGQFVDFTDGSVFRDTFPASGTATGPTVLGGFRVPIGIGSVGFEARWQNAVGDMPAGQGFAGNKIDLGGWNYLGTFKVRF